MKNHFYAFLVFLFVPFAGADENTGWIDAHNTCFEDMKSVLGQPGPQVYNYVKLMASSKGSQKVHLDTHSDWGNVNVFPVVMDNSLQLVVMGKGMQFIALLPQPKITEYNDSIAEITGRKIKEWNLKLNFSNRLPLWITMRENVSRGVSSVNVSAFGRIVPEDRSYDGLQEVSAVESQSAQIRIESADNIVRVLIHNSERRQFPLSIRTTALLGNCKASLDSQNSEDQRIIEEIMRFLSKDEA